MMQAGSMTRLGRLAIGVAASTLTLSACSQKTDDVDTETTATAPANTGTAAAPAAPAAAAPAPDNTDTVSGVKFASYTGDATNGAVVFLQCKTCHEVTPGVNKIGPSLAKIVGRSAGTIAGFTYTPANRDSGITWTPDKLFQYLENPQRVVPGTKMAFAGIPDPQKRADVIAYLQAN